VFAYIHIIIIIINNNNNNNKDQNFLTCDLLSLSKINYDWQLFLFI